MVFHKFARSSRLQINLRVFVLLFNYLKLFFLIHRQRFLYMNVGSPGRCNDSSIYEKSQLKQEHLKPIMSELRTKISGVDVPLLIIGDSAFRFSRNLMKPYPFSIAMTDREKKFNYVLSKCRRVVENAFGHLKARFRRLGKGLDNKIENSRLINKSCCLLHNIMNVHNDEINCSWYEQFRTQGRERSREQPPEIGDTYNDRDSSAEVIRQAIANSFCKFKFISKFYQL